MDNLIDLFFTFYRALDSFAQVHHMLRIVYSICSYQHIKNLDEGLMNCFVIYKSYHKSIIKSIIHLSLIKFRLDNFFNCAHLYVIIIVGWVGLMDFISMFQDFRGRNVHVRMVN